LKIGGIDITVVQEMHMGEKWAAGVDSSRLLLTPKGYEKIWKVYVGNIG